MNKVMRIYDVLYKAYGPQGWWPLTQKYKFIPEHKGEKPNSEQRKESSRFTITKDMSKNNHH